MPAAKTDLPWVEKYRPKSLKEMVGFENLTNTLRKFIDQFFILQKQHKNLKKAIHTNADAAVQRKMKLKLKSLQSKMLKGKSKLLIGPPGVGKTTIVYALAHDYNLSVIELNASDARTEDALKKKLSESVKSINLLAFTVKKTKGKLILIDEVDGIHGQSDRGGVKTLEKIIGYSKFPIIMTCNFRDDKKFKSLYQLAAPLIEVKKAHSKDVSAMLRIIAQKEKITISDRQIQQVVQNAQGDYRSAINDLQALAQGGTNLEDEALEGINMQRDSEANLQDFMGNLLTAGTIIKAKRSLDKINHKDIDMRTIHKWIHENLPNFLTKKQDLYFAYEHMAIADRILGYIMRTQDYGHLSYFYDILAGGILLSKSDKILPKSQIRPPRWFSLRATPEDVVALALERHFRVSLNTIMRQIKPNLKLFLKYKPKIMQDYLAGLLNVQPKQIPKILGVKF